MKKDSILAYDGTFEGFLTCVFQTFEQKLNVTAIYTEDNIQQDFFSLPEPVITDLKKASRVKQALKTKLDSGSRRQLYFSF